MAVSLGVIRVSAAACQGSPYRSAIKTDFEGTPPQDLTQAARRAIQGHNCARRLQQALQSRQQTIERRLAKTDGHPAYDTHPIRRNLRCTMRGWPLAVSKGAGQGVIQILALWCRVFLDEGLRRPSKARVGFLHHAEQHIVFATDEISQARKGGSQGGLARRSKLLPQP